VVESDLWPAAVPRRVGWIVDVQNDFMRPPEEGGRLYVHDLRDASDPGARLARPRIEAAVAWMRRKCDLMVYTGDWHGLDDAEIDPVAPDPAAGTYPPHCMGRSADPEERKGARILDSVRPIAPLVLEPNAAPSAARATALQAIDERRPIFIHKNRFDVFEGNAGTEPLLEALTERWGARPEFVVVGVARDVCVTGAVDGLQARGYRTIVVRDATWGLGLEEEEVTLARWRRGGSVVTLEELTTGAGSRAAPDVPGSSEVG